MTYIHTFIHDTYIHYIQEHFKKKKKVQVMYFQRSIFKEAKLSTTANILRIVGSEQCGAMNVAAPYIETAQAPPIVNAALV